MIGRMCVQPIPTDLQLSPIARERRIPVNMSPEYRQNTACPSANVGGGRRFLLPMVRCGVICVRSPSSFVSLAFSEPTVLLKCPFRYPLLCRGVCPLRMPSVNGPFSFNDAVAETPFGGCWATDFQNAAMSSSHSSSGVSRMYSSSLRRPSSPALRLKKRTTASDRGSPCLRSYRYEAREVQEEDGEN